MSERALEELELEGLVPFSRLDFLLGALVNLTKKLVVSKGVSPEDLDRALSAGALNVYKAEPEDAAEDAETTARRNGDFLATLSSLAKQKK